MTSIRQLKNVMNPKAFDAFISYSSKNKQIADAVKHGLHSSGIRCWMAPDDIQPGGDWAAEVADAIEACSVMVLIWTSASMSSVEVPKELGLAMSSGSIVIPFRLENIEPHGSFKYHLTGRHWLDAYDTDLDEAIKQLTELVGANINKLQSPANSSSVIIDPSEVSVGVGDDIIQSTGIPNEDQEVLTQQLINMNDKSDNCSLTTSAVPPSPHISNESAVESPMSNYLTSGTQVTEIPDTYIEKTNGDVTDGESNFILETFPKLQDCPVSSSSDKACTLDQLVEDREANFTDKIPMNHVGAAEESRLGVKVYNPNLFSDSDALSRWAREIELICYSAEQLVPELDRTIFKRGFVSRKIMGARRAPSIGELTEGLVINMHLTFLWIATFCFVSSVECNQFDMIGEFISSNRIRSVSRFIYENAACIQKILFKNESSEFDGRGLEEEFHSLFVNDLSCCVKIPNSKGGYWKFYNFDGLCLFYLDTPGSVSADRINNVFARTLEVRSYLLPAVLSMVDIVVPSDPSLRSLVAERLCSFVQWSMDVSASSISDYLGVDDIRDREFFVRLKCMSERSAIEDAVAKLPYCQKIDANKNRLSSFNIAFDRLVKISTLKQAAGFVVQC